MAEKIIAVSAGREITETEFNEFLSKLPEQQQAYVATEEGRKQALTQYANYFLFEKLGYDKKYDQDEAFIATMEAVKRELLGQYALTQEIKDIQATQEECEAYYNEHKAMFVKEAKDVYKRQEQKQSEAFQKKYDNWTKKLEKKWDYNKDVDQKLWAQLSLKSADSTSTEKAEETTAAK